jgi:serine/threonine protein kinase
MTNLLGQSIGRYHILDQLGEGGMAIVYKAYDTRLDRDVAVKFIRRGAFPPDFLDHMLKRFEREAKSLAKLSHPHIVGVIDYGEHEGSPYLVMEYLPGGTLKQSVGKPIPWQEAARILLPIAQALEYAHEHNLVHRDIKPSNILLTDKGQPMLTDFGIAKILESDETATLTGTGVGIGTPEYMAPEQWTGQATKQSDIYSLGVVLYEMVTGRKPYTADTPAAILLKQANDPLPRPRAILPDLPENAERVLLKALARNPQDRYESMQQFANALESLSAKETSTGVTLASSRKRDEILTQVEPTGTASGADPGWAPTQELGRPARAEKRPARRIPWLIGIGAAILVCVLIGGIVAVTAILPMLAASPTPVPTVTPIVATPTVVLPLTPTLVPTSPPTADVVIFPTIDGKIGEGEWTSGSASSELSNGYMYTLNDDRYLYLLLDLTGDTGDDPARSSSPWGDFFYITFDIDNDSVIDNEVDLNYGLYPGSYSSMGFQYYLGSDTWTGLYDSTSNLHIGFTSSSNSHTPHRIWEFAFDLSELQARPGDSLGIGIRTWSETPSFDDYFPSYFTSDFSNLYIVYVK